MVSGDYGAFKKKHRGDIQEFTPAKITEYIKFAGDAFLKIQKQRELMKSVEIDSRITAELVGRMILEKEFIQSSQVNIIQNELKHPTFDYNSSNSLWELYQFTTFAMKELHPSLWMGNHIDAHDFFVNAYGELKSNVIKSNSPITNQFTIFDELKETVKLIE